MISVVAVDLDETLLQSDGSVSPRTLDSLAAWEKAGRRAVIATGRPPRSARKIPDSLLHLPCICYNGAAIYLDGRLAYSRTIPAADAWAIVEHLLAAMPDGRVGIEIEDVLYLNKPTDRPGVCFTPDLLGMAARPAAKIIMSLTEYLQAVSAGNGLPDSARALLSEKYDLAQIMPSCSSKATALAHLMGEWGVPLAQVAAFGDDVNDVEMVAEAGLGVAMDNAVPEVKAVANRITLSNDQDGVAVVVEELLGI